MWVKQDIWRLYKNETNDKASTIVMVLNISLALKVILISLLQAQDDEENLSWDMQKHRNASVLLIEVKQNS